jgi:hypothetical protein
MVAERWLQRSGLPWRGQISYSDSSFPSAR